MRIKWALRWCLHPAPRRAPAGELILKNLRSFYCLPSGRRPLPRTDERSERLTFGVTEPPPLSPFPPPLKNWWTLGTEFFVFRVGPRNDQPLQLWNLSYNILKSHQQYSKYLKKWNIFRNEILWRPELRCHPTGYGMKRFELYVLFCGDLADNQQIRVQNWLII